MAENNQKNVMPPDLIEKWLQKLAISQTPEL
jgi:hypothetical protein